MSVIPVLFVIGITVFTIGLGIWATRMARTASDFFVAGRSVSVFWNGSAISGEYLSAASFMGIAGMIMKNGYDALWYPVCYATGYLFLLLFIAGPLRRFGAYTIPDFAEGRFDSPIFRRIAVTFVMFIGFFYTMPQMKGAGITMQGILGWPYWTGILVVGAVITFNVALGGMKGITFVQAFQYWAKAFAISVPVFVLMALYRGYGEGLQEMALQPKEYRNTADDAKLRFKGSRDKPANAVTFAPVGSAYIMFPNGAALDHIGPARKAAPSADPIPPTALSYIVVANRYQFSGLKYSPVAIGPDGSATLPKSAVLRVRTYRVTSGGKPEMKDGKPVTSAIKLEFREPTDAILLGGAVAPNQPSNGKWAQPFGTLTGKYNHPLLYTYSLIIALVCGTAGLPHILVRFYTNPDGRAAKRTTLWVMVMIGTFYLFPPIWGVLGRLGMPSLYANSTTDSVVIKLPTILENHVLGQLLSGITSAGAFAAFMSTFSGLLVSMSGAMAHDIYGKILRPNAPAAARLLAFRIAAILFGIVAMGLGLLVERFDINMMVGWAFAIAAASYFPLLLLGSWWRGLTRQGAAIGMLGGGLLSLAAIVSTMLMDIKLIHAVQDPIARTLLEQPAIWAVPLALVTMYIVSKITSRHVPEDTHLKMLRLHAPEEMGLSKNYIAEH